MKGKEESAKTGLHVDIKRAKVMTTEEIHNFHTDNEDTELVKDCLPCFRNQFQWRRSQKNLKKAENRRGSNGRKN